MRSRLASSLSRLLILLLASFALRAGAADRPNIVLILAMITVLAVQAVALAYIGRDDLANLFPGLF